MAASTKSLLQYITGIILVFLLTWHLVLRVPWLRGVDSFAETLAPEKIYEEVSGLSGVLLLIFAYAVLYHGFNGLRNVLLEWSGGRYDKVITVVIVVLFIVFAGLATYTVVGTQPPA